MLRELFTIPGLGVPIYGYGLMLVIACLSAIQLARYLSVRVGINPDRFSDLGFVALLSGVVGARLVHVIECWSDYFTLTPDHTLWDAIIAAVDIRHGGLVFYGGFLLATPSCIVYAIRHKMPLFRTMDVAAPCLMLGLALGRVGCFLNGCCWGQVCSTPPGVSFPYKSPAQDEQVRDKLLSVPDALRTIVATDTDGEPISAYALPFSQLPDALKPQARAFRSLPVHPTQLYSVVTALLISGACVVYMGNSLVDGRVFSVMLMMEGTGRFVIEMLRVNDPVFHVGSFAITLSMSIGVLVVAGGVLSWFAFAMRKPQSNSSAITS